MNGHFLTRRDGRWLVDRRDPTPLKRRVWTHKRDDQDWPWKLKADDFVDVLTRRNPAGFPICVRGRWSDLRDDHIENVQIASAWMDSNSSGELAALLRRSNPFFYGLPDYEETDFEVNDVPFDLTGWLLTGEVAERGLDKFDPHARDILYPPLQIGASFAAALGLSSDRESRIWANTSEEAGFLSEVWSDEDISEKDKSYRYGTRLSATVGILRKLCAQRQQTLIFDVRIEREIDRRYRSHDADELGYAPPSHNIHARFRRRSSRYEENLLPLILLSAKAPQSWLINLCAVGRPFVHLKSAENCQQNCQRID